MRFDSSQVCEHQNIGCHLRVLFWDAELGPDAIAKLLELSLLNGNLVDC